MEEEKDEELINQYLKGEEKSLEILIKRYLKPIFSFVYRYTGNVQEAEDITQEVFVRVWKNIKKFDRKKSLKTWIFSIAKNAAIDFLRRKRVIPFSSFSIKNEEGGEGENSLMENLVDPAPLPSEIFARKDLAQELTAVVEKLPLKYSLVLFLHYNDHFTFQEIAELLEEPFNTIRSRHQRAIMMLRESFLEC